jgi:predicted RNA-binding Zn-ribbon protein involved in translation (DUF1610 family)
MAVVDQKERYRRQAALCYEIAAKMTPKKAAPMVRLGDTYSALAVDRNRRARNVFVPTKRLDQPHCKVCGRKMRLACALPRTRTLPSMQAFRCDRCGETLIWRSASPSLSTRMQSPSTAHPEDSRWITRHVAISFRRIENGFSPGEAIECPDARLAVRRAQLMMREKDTVGSVAFSRRSNEQTGEVETAEILTVGKIPDGFDIA